MGFDRIRIKEKLKALRNSADQLLEPRRSAAIAIVGGVLLLCLFLSLAHFFFRLPDARLLRDRYPVVKADAHASRGFRVVLQKARPKLWISINDVAPIAVSTILISEDWAFYRHQGYDLEQIQEAIRRDLQSGTFARGGSTITQQVAKNVFLSAEKTLTRKAKELILAVRMEKDVGKKKILESYFNIAEWGEGIFGIRAAASRYFSKHPSQLTAKEAAFLAMLLPSPKRYAASFRNKELTPFARRIVKNLLKKLRATQRLSEEEYLVQLMTPLSFEKITHLPTEVEATETFVPGEEEAPGPQDEESRGDEELVPANGLVITENPPTEQDEQEINEPTEESSDESAENENIEGIKSEETISTDSERSEVLPASGAEEIHSEASGSENEPDVLPTSEGTEEPHSEAPDSEKH